MKQVQLVKAYMVLDKLAKVTFPLTISNKIFHMKEKLQSQYDFQSQEETKSFQDNHGSFNADNKMTFQTVEDYNAFECRMKELRDLEIDIEIQPFDIPISDNIMLTADEIKDLNGFVNFIE